MTARKLSQSYGKTAAPVCSSQYLEKVQGHGRGQLKLIDARGQQSLGRVVPRFQYAPETMYCKAWVSNSRL